MSTKKLWTDGVLVAIEVRRWGGAVTLKAEDLDITEQPKIIELGRKFLMPKEALREIMAVEQKARVFLKNNSVPFIISAAHFVPLHKFERVIENLKVFKTEFYTAVEKLIADFETHKATIQRTYPKIFEKLEKHYPADLNAIRELHGFDFITLTAEFPENLDQGINAARKAIVDSDLAEKYAQAQKLNYAQMQSDFQSKLDTFFSDSLKLVRGKAVDAMEQIATKLKKGEIITRMSLRSVKHAIEAVKDMNFMGDDEMLSKLAEVQAELEKGGYNDEDSQENRQRLGASIISALTTAASASDVAKVAANYRRKLEL